MNTRLPDLLHDLASEMPTETRTPARRTLRRARTRRAAVAAFTGATVIVVALGTLTGLRALSSDPNGRPVVPGTDGPTAPAPAGFQGLWPETDADALAEAQAAVDDGHQPLRLDPAQTAAMLATNLFGWSYDATEPRVVTDNGDRTTVEIRNADFGDDIPPMMVELTQLGRTGPDGIWSVVRVSTPLIVGLSLDLPTEGNPRTIHFQGMLSGLEGLDVRAVLTHPAGGDQPIWGGSPAGGFFEGSWEGSTELAGAVLWIHVFDEPNEITLGASAMPLNLGAAPPTPSPTPPLDFRALPPDVAVTAQRIYDGALARDFDALAELLDPNTFAYNFDDGSDPIPAWREDPSVLDLAAAILEVPGAEPREIEGYGTFYLWPYLIDSDFSALTEQERADLAFLGYSDEEIQLMIDGGYDYQGPRLGIDADGLWRNFTTVGE